MSFTDREEWAQQWVHETCAAFPFLLDPDRTLYRSFGLQRSLLRSWNLRTLWRYARYILSGRGLKPIQGDSAQLGGDFILDDEAVLRYSHRSDDPVDRPPVAELLQVLTDLARS